MVNEDLSGAAGASQGSAASSPPHTLPFSVLFEDPNLIVLSKPAGLLSQGDISGETSLVDLLRVYFGRNYVGLIHRVDRNTSGLMIVAKRSKAAERLTEQLQKGQLERFYHAILWGSFASTKPERWEHYLVKNESTNEVRVVKGGTPKAKIAVLTAIPKLALAAHDGSPLTLTRFELETGRSHQIRVQSQAEKHPLIGDTKYGNRESMQMFARPALHSSELSFFHPISREKMTFSEPFSEDMVRAFPELNSALHEKKPS